MKPHHASRTFLGLCFLLFSPLASAQHPLFEPLHDMLPPDGDATYAIELGDVDGDGDLDAMIGNLEEGACSDAWPCHGPAPNRLFLNDGSGLFLDVTASHLPQVLAITNAIAFGDVDGDGDLDAAIGNYGQNQLYLNDGSGVFTDVTATHVPVGWERSTSVALGDVDADGDLDWFVGNGITCAFANCGGSQNGLYLNDGTGVFTDATANLPPGSDGTNSVALGDVDEDGDLDALIGNHVLCRMGPGPGGCSPGSAVLLNDGSGVYADATATHLPRDDIGASSVALGDMDGDADLDAVLGAQIFLNDGFGRFQGQPAVFADIAFSEVFHRAEAGTLRLGDVDGDRDLDVVTGYGLYLNQGAAIFSDVSSRLPSIDGVTTLALGDLDADGDLDALLGSYQGLSTGRRDRLWLNDGTGSFTDVKPRDFPLVYDPSAAVDLGDIDGDGDLDVLVGNGSGVTTWFWAEQNRLYRNVGAGIFEEAPPAHLPQYEDATTDLVLGDVDGDRDLDALVANVVSPTRLYRNDGTGVFSDETTGNVPQVPWSTKTYAMALGDVDGDGDLDAVIGAWVQNILFLNDGSGTFTDVTSSNLPQVNDLTQAVALGDVDDDGDLDVLFGNRRPTGQDRLYLNDGAGIFSDVTATHLPPRLTDSYAVVLADLDGDSDLDAWTSTRLYLNDGTGVFSDVTVGHLPSGFEVSDIVLGDVDEDGDLDGLTTTGLYLNDGSGVFTDATATRFSAQFTAGIPALGDLDGDRDLDAFVAATLWSGIGENRIFTNLTRQVAWRTLPRLGHSLVLDLFGAPGDSWLLLASTSTASAPLSFGTFRLDPLSLLTIGSGSFDASGRSSITFLVPNDSSYEGRSLYWQALIAFPLSLTNLEVTTFADL